MSHESRGGNSARVGDRSPIAGELVPSGVGDVIADRRDRRQDARDLKQDKQEVRQDRRERRQDAKDKAGKERMKAYKDELSPQEIKDLVGMVRKFKS